MNFLEKHATILFTILVSVIGGFSVYYFMVFLFMAQAITIPLAIIISLLIFSLTRYYSASVTEEYLRTSKGLAGQRDVDGFSGHNNISKSKLSKGTPVKLSSFLCFIAIYAIVLAVSGFSKPHPDIFTNWNYVGAGQIIQLAAAILLVFFIPGYAVMLVISEKSRSGNILKVIFGYLLSILITGSTAYISATSFDVSVFEIKYLLTFIYLVILACFVTFYILKNKGIIRTQIGVTKINKPTPYRPFMSGVLQSALLSKLVPKGPELVVFASLFSLLIIFTYYTYGGITVGDQWYHQGRAITISSGSFRQTVLAGAESEYPPFQSALISSLTSLSGIPLVNAYASIAFLNIIPLFAFYYFYSNWIPSNLRKASLFACTLFMLASGFGWIYLSNLAATTALDTINSEHEAVVTIDSMRSYILMPSNFILASHPDFSTALIYIALPSGLVLLGISRQLLQNKAVKTSAVAIIAVIGILSHEEFYFFIITASLVLLVFRIKEANYVYTGIILALSAIFAINTIAPVNYYTYTEIFGIPLLYLCFLFVAIMWLLYIGVQNIGFVKSILKVGPTRKVGEIHISSLESIRRVVKSNRTIRIFLQLFVISVVAYMYVSSFIILAPLSLHDVNDEALRGVVPWYQYPMKLGLMGLLGVAFILSYLFKRFEKEIFVFGIIIVIALLTGPFYDQHRFSKYLMMGMVAFASLLIYRLLDFRYNYRPIVNPILITAIIMTASLSTLVFVGYNSLAFENHEYAHDLGRRNFPTESEFQLLEAVRPNASIDFKLYNIISTPNEYNFFKGTLLTKLSTFDGIPPGKLLQGRFVLNVTTLDALYRLLDYSDARYIIIPKNDIINENRLTQPVRFALDSFRHIYEDSKYVVLEVPPLTPPSSSSSGETDVALVLRQIDSLSESNGITRVLEYNNDTFNSNQLMKATKLENKNIHDNQSKTQNIVLCGNESNKNQGTAVWSSGLNSASKSEINSAEIGFSVIGRYDGSGWSDAGLRWKDEYNEYYVSLSKNGLELYQITVPIDGSKGYDKKLVYQNTEVQKKDGVWYKLKAESLQNSINVYVNDMLRIKVPRMILGDAGNDTVGIDSVAISCYGNPTQFTPIRLGNPSKSVNYEDIEGIKNNNYRDYDYYYYPLSILALSGGKYDTFLDTDLSALSKKFIVLSFDPLDWDDARFDHYMEYVHNGGTLIVITSDNNFKGRFSQLLSIKSNDNATNMGFTDIASIKNKSNRVNISGEVKNIKIGSSNTSIIASYSNNAGNITKDDTNQTIPFALEKTYHNGGKIILVNAAGYFDAIPKSKGFLSLAKISDIVGLHLENKPDSFVTSLPPEQFVGDMVTTGTGNAKLQSSSLLLDNDPSDPRNDDSDDGRGQSISHRYLNAQNITVYDNNQLKRTFNNASIKSIELVGDYKVEVNSMKELKIPYMTSQHNYIGVSVPPGFNMTISLSSEPLTYAKIVMQNEKNQTSNDAIKINGSSVILFNDMQTMLLEEDSHSAWRSASIPILLKNPDIEVNGISKFATLRFFWHYLEKIPIEEQGLKTRIDFVDHYSEPYGNGTKIEYITFINSTTNLR